MYIIKISEPDRFVKMSLQQQLKDNGIPSSLSPESSRIGHTVERQNYLWTLEDSKVDKNQNRAKNIFVLLSIKILRFSSQMHWAVFLPSGLRLSDCKLLELRRREQFKQGFTEVPIRLRNSAMKIYQRELSRQQWKVILPTLKDHFPPVPRRFYLLLIKLSFGLGFLTKRLCGDCTHFCPLIFGSVLRSRIVCSMQPMKSAWMDTDPLNMPYWLNKIFPYPLSR